MQSTYKNNVNQSMYLDYIMKQLFSGYNLWCSVILRNKRFVPLHQYCPKYVHSAQYGCLL
jgi:hypothetical protein